MRFLSLVIALFSDLRTDNNYQSHAFGNAKRLQMRLFLKLLSNCKKSTCLKIAEKERKSFRTGSQWINKKEFRQKPSGTLAVIKISQKQRMKKFFLSSKKTLTVRKIPVLKLCLVKMLRREKNNK